MLVIRAGLKALRVTPKISANFAKKKKGKGQDDDDAKGEQQVIKQQVKIDQKQVNKSAALYDQYVKSRQRPMLTLDNYQIKFVLLLERDAIFLPHNPRRFQHYRQKYLAFKKTGYYPALVKDVAVDQVDYRFTEYERVNPENEITHRNIISKTEVYEYAEHARYWKYTDPNIQDPHSAQTFSSHNVFLITKNRQGKWQFPTRTLSEKDNHKQIFTVMTNQLFGGTGGPILYFPNKKPFYARKTQDSNLSRGRGYAQYFFQCYSLNGVPKFPTENYLDYAWVPKAHLANYFEDGYFQSTIKLAKHLF